MKRLLVLMAAVMLCLCGCKDEAARKKVAQAVSYTEQELTPEQQAQARKNIGALGATASIENGVLKVELATIKDNILIIK